MLLFGLLGCSGSSLPASTTGDTGAPRSTADTGAVTVDTCPWTGTWALEEDWGCGGAIETTGASATMVLAGDGAGCAGVIDAILPWADDAATHSDLIADPVGVGDLVDLAWMLTWDSGNVEQGAGTAVWGHAGGLLVTDYTAMPSGPWYNGCTSSGGLSKWARVK